MYCRGVTEVPMHKLGNLLMPTHMVNIFGKFHWNPSTKYRDIETSVNRRTTDGQITDGWTDNL